MKVLLSCVNYKSYEMLDAFCTSVENAARQCKDVAVTLLVGDNTDRDYREIQQTLEHVDVRVFPYHDNCGYLGCAFRMLNDFGRENYLAFDYVSVSNVDLTLDENFFVRLLALNADGIGWVAPDIITPSRGTHDNPYMLIRPTNRDFIKWEILYSNAFLYGILEKILYRRQSKQTLGVVGSEMYAAHGSFMLFTRQFLERQTELSFPCFMYAEEIFIAELMRRDKLKVVYRPELIVQNVGSVSISTFGYSWKCQQNIKSLRAIRRRFFTN